MLDTTYSGDGVATFDDPANCELAAAPPVIAQLTVTPDSTAVLLRGQLSDQGVLEPSVSVMRPNGAAGSNECVFDMAYPTDVVARDNRTLLIATTVCNPGRGCGAVSSAIACSLWCSPGARYNAQFSQVSFEDEMAPDPSRDPMQ